MSELEKKRKEIEKIDNEIFSLLNERMKIVKEIGGLKKDQRKSIVDKNREIDLVNKISKESLSYLNQEDIHRIYSQLFQISRRIQGEEISVAFLGPSGTFTEQAAREVFKEKNANYHPYDTITEVFRAVVNDETEVGIVPVENTTAGTVALTLDLLIEYDIKVCGEIIQRISHTLLAPKSIPLERIKQVYSHPHALSQCRKFLDERLKKAELVATTSTTKAVEMIRNKENAAAISTELSAKLYNLVTLSRGIEDNPNNFTRFFILGKEPISSTGHDKTSIVFTVKHEPGALFEALKIFSDLKINLTKLESRPLKSTPWEYLFILDFQGHQNDDVINKAFKELQKVTTMVKIFGSYPAIR